MHSTPCIYTSLFRSPSRGSISRNATGENAILEGEDERMHLPQHQHQQGLQQAGTFSPSAHGGGAQFARAATTPAGTTAAGDAQRHPMSASELEEEHELTTRLVDIDSIRRSMHALLHSQQQAQQQRGGEQGASSGDDVTGDLIRAAAGYIRSARVSNASVAVANASSGIANGLTGTSTASIGGQNGGSNGMYIGTSISEAVSELAMRRARVSNGEVVPDYTAAMDTRDSRGSVSSSSGFSGPAEGVGSIRNGQLLRTSFYMRRASSGGLVDGGSVGLRRLPRESNSSSSSSFGGGGETIAPPTLSLRYTQQHRADGQPTPNQQQQRSYFRSLVGVSSTASTSATFMGGGGANTFDRDMNYTSTGAPSASSQCSPRNSWPNYHTSGATGGTAGLFSPPAYEQSSNIVGINGSSGSSAPPPNSWPYSASQRPLHSSAAAPQYFLPPPPTVILHGRHASLSPPPSGRHSYSFASSSTMSLSRLYPIAEGDTAAAATSASNGRPPLLLLLLLLPLLHPLTVVVVAVACALSPRISTTRGRCCLLWRAIVDCMRWRARGTSPW